MLNIFFIQVIILIMIIVVMITTTKITVMMTITIMMNRKCSKSIVLFTITRKILFLLSYIFLLT